MASPTVPASSVAAEGLSSAQAAERLQTFGANAVEERPVPAWKRLALRFWGPLPWMLEVTIALTLALSKDLQAGIIAGLLVLNGVLAFLQSAKADRALAALRQRLAVTARARRDGIWQRIPARDLVPGDLVRVRTGDVVPADLDLVDGHVSVDQSTLTGESFPEDLEPGAPVLGSSLVQRGEATGVVTATGSRSFFGRTARLVQEARPPTVLERAVFSIIRYLVVIDVVLVAAMIGFALLTGTSMSEVAPFALIVLIASVPVALPATFSAAQAIGAQTLIRDHGVLVTRLQAVQEAASMDVLCTDKTGTLTTNHLELAAAEPYGALDRSALLELAALASDPAGQDPIDLAILAAAPESEGGWQRLDFHPFDPATKRTEAVLERVGAPLGRGGGERRVVVKGMPDVVVAACA
ncbi:MAG TPA: HAD-IC family P-type ATPase, partial [Actinomycetota bacterium]|nr:HAD-IC family P-type ATPase [Actinomycetota bacterium]